MSTRRKRIRPKSRDNYFTKLKALHCFREVDQRVKAGWPITSVVDFIQKEREEYNDVNRESLCKTLRSYRDRMGKTEILKNYMPDKVEQWMGEMEEAIDEVKELAKLYQIQVKRIVRAVNGEDTTDAGMLYKTLNQEMVVAQNILKTSSEIKLEYGLVKRSPDGSPASINILNMDLATKYGSEAVQKVVQNPLARRKVLALVERMSKKKLPEEEKVIDAELANGD